MVGLPISLDKENYQAQSGERDPCKTIYVVFALYYKSSIFLAISLAKDDTYHANRAALVGDQT